MPALKICGNPTFLAGDDLRTYSAFAVALRILQLGVVIPFTIRTKGHFDIPVPPGCQGDGLLQHTEAIFISYVVLTFVVALTGLALEFGILRTTGRGTPTQPEQRWMLQPLCMIKMGPMSFLRVVALALTVLCILVVRDLCRCANCPKYKYRQWNILFSILAISHIIESFAVFMYATYFGCKARPRIPVKTPSAETKWRICCKCCCTVSSVLTCCLAGGRDSQASSDFTELAMILANFFSGGGILNVVLSDIVVGFRMLGREQKQRELLSRNEVIQRSSIIQQNKSKQNPSFVDLERNDQGDTTSARAVSLLSRKDASHKYVVAQGARFMRYAEAVYFFQPHSYPGKRVMTGCRTIVEDTIDSGTKSYLLSICNFDRETTEIVYAQFLQGLAKTPYGIFIDHAWKSIVVSIRGTMSLDDVVADLTLTPTSMEDWGARCGFDGSDCFVHTGVLKCAEWIHNDLERHGWLDKLLSDESSRGVDGYRLVLTGHSLGAGCASVLSFMLKGKFPGLKCLAFSPPGCTLSLKMAQECEAYCTSYVLDTDIVPRLSLVSMEDLRDSILEMIARIKVPKYEAMHAKRDVEAGRLIHSRADTPASTFEEQLKKFREHLAVKKSEREELYIPLYPPGKIVHLVKTGDDEQPSGCCSCGGNVDNTFQQEISYAARWAQREDFAEVFISSNFVSDHKTVNVLSELEKVAEQFGLCSPFTISENSSSSENLVADAEEESVPEVAREEVEENDQNSLLGDVKR